MDRQKKLLIFGLAWVSAGLLTWFLYAKTVAPQQERKAQVVVASHDMPMGTLLRKSDLKLVNYPEKDVPKGVVFQTSGAEGRVLLVPMNSNEPVLLTKLSAATSVEGVSSTIDPGFRAVSVPITDASGVAGLVQPNSRVDVIFTRPGTMAEATTSIILQNVKVLSTGRSTPTGTTPDPRAPRSQVVTLLLTPTDAQKLELAKNQGKVSLSLRNPLDSMPRRPTRVRSPPRCSIRTSVSARRWREKAGWAAGPFSQDPNVWQELKGQKKPPEEKKKEPEKPRVIVDVYRGDRHVQELFK